MIILAILAVVGCVFAGAAFEDAKSRPSSMRYR